MEVSTTKMEHQIQFSEKQGLQGGSLQEEYQENSQMKLKETEAMEIQTHQHQIQTKPFIQNVEKPVILQIQHQNQKKVQQENSNVISIEHSHQKLNKQQLSIHQEAEIVQTAKPHQLNQEQTQNLQHQNQFHPKIVQNYELSQTKINGEIFSYTQPNQPPIAEAKPEITLQQLEQLQMLTFSELKSKLSEYFPHFQQQFLNLGDNSIIQFLRNTICYYKSIQQIEQVTEYHYPPLQKMIQITVGLLPQFQEQIESKNEEQLKVMFKEALEQQSKENSCNLFQFEYLKQHPFEVIVQKRKPLIVNLTLQDIHKFMYFKVTVHKRKRLIVNPTLEEIRSSRNKQEQLPIQQTFTRQCENTLQNRQKFDSENAEIQQQNFKTDLIQKNKELSQKPAQILQNLLLQVPKDSQLVSQSAPAIVTQVEHEEFAIQLPQSNSTEKSSKDNQQSGSKNNQFRVLVEADDSRSQDYYNQKSSEVNENKGGRENSREINQTRAPEKRTFQSMTATNSQNTKQNQTNKQSVDVQKNVKKSKFNIPDLRQKLLQKLPELKSSIIQLNDQEIQKIFLESIQTTSKPKLDKEKVHDSKLANAKIAEKKGVLTRSDLTKMNEKSQVTVPLQSKSSIPVIPNLINKKQLLANKSRNGTTQIAEFSSPNNNSKTKKTRTIMLVHTEEDQSQENITKRKMNDNGELKCNCACCRKNSENIPGAFKQFLRLLINQ